MDVLKEMLGVLTKPEIKGLKSHVSENSYAAVKRLLDYYTVDENSTEAVDITTHLMGAATKKSLNAYHQLRFQLIQALEEFIRNQSYHTEITYISTVDNLLIAEFFFERKQTTLGWKYLKKAEALAIEAHQFSLLDRIYYIQLEYAHFRPETDNSDLILKWQQNKGNAQIENNLNAALSTIRSKIRMEQEAGRLVDIEAITGHIYQHFNINENGLNTVSYQTKLCIMLFELMEPKGENAACAEYLIKTYELLSQHPNYVKLHGKERAELLTRIAESLVKSKDFVKCESYLDLLDEQLIVNNAPYMRQLKCRFIRSICYVSTNRPIESYNLLKQIENNKNKPSSKEEDFYLFRTLTANWCSNYYYRGHIREALKYIAQMQEKEKRLVAEYGIRSGLYLNFYEIMFRIDLQEHKNHHQVEFLLSRIKSVERRYKQTLDDVRNVSMELFLQILKSLVLNPSYIETVAGKEAVATFSGFQRADVYKAELISLNAWLTHKITGRAVYECYLYENGYTFVAQNEAVAV